MNGELVKMGIWKGNERIGIGKLDMLREYIRKLDQTSLGVQQDKSR